MLGGKVLLHSGHVRDLEAGVQHAELPVASTDPETSVATDRVREVPVQIEPLHLPVRYVCMCKQFLHWHRFFRLALLQFETIAYFITHRTSLAYPDILTSSRGPASICAPCRRTMISAASGLLSCARLSSAGLARYPWPLPRLTPLDLP